MSTNKPSVKTPDIPLPSDFFIAAPLYRVHHFAYEADGEVLKVTKFHGTLDLYCSHCRQTVVFISESADRMRHAIPYPGGNGQPETPRVPSGHVVVKFFCSRNHHHVLTFFFLVEKDYDAQEIRLTKVGQDPSQANLSTAELRKYRKILGEERFGEFNRAVGLATHGVGIGSFIYLRRIFEHLIEDAHQHAAQGNGWDEDLYFKSRVDQKIDLLQNDLPIFLVENRKIYGILSKGVHELSEQDCLAHFDVLKGSIELILDQKIEEQEQQSKAAKLSSAINTIAGKLKS